jgi:hypothetical protein
MRKSVSQASIFIFSILAIAGCVYHDVILNKMVVDRVTYYESENQVGEYNYDSDGKVTRYNFHYDNQLVQYTNYLYENGHLSSKVYFLLSNDNFVLATKDLMQYNASGQITSMIKDADGAQETTYKFFYDGERIVKVQKSNLIQGQLLVTGYCLIDYDQRGNAIKQSYYILGNSGPDVLRFTIDFEFDQKMNPFLEVNDAYDMLYNNDVNPNNVVKSVNKSADGEVTATYDITYTYNQHNLPETRTQLYTSGSYSNSSVTKFAYKKI